MRVLIACEYSGTVRDAFRKRGHDAWSCDILPTDADPAYHYQQDIRELLTKDWDLMIAHPPCTYLTNSGVCWLHKDLARWGKLEEGLDFFRLFLDSTIPKVCIENPIPHKYAVSGIGKYTQIVHPYMFGHMERKATCLWLKGLPLLKPTNLVKTEMEKLPKNQQQRLHYLPPSPERAKLRSKTFQGIAEAMAEQWGEINYVGREAATTEEKPDKKDRSKNRHKPGYIPPSRRNPDNPDVPRPKGRPPKPKQELVTVVRPKGRPPKPQPAPKPPKVMKAPHKHKGWNGKFVSVDGEGWDGKFTLLACSAHTYDLYSPDGLPTRACLRYLTDWGVKGGDALVGFGLSYDFENILRDVPDDDYKKMMNNEAIQFHEFTLKYIPRKILEIKRDLDRLDDKGKPRFKTVFLQDTMGYFQMSFEKALEKFEIPIPPIITEGKALRGDFNKVPLSFIKAYNREELRLHVQMMEIIRVSGKEAFEAIGLEAQATPRTWFGPGAWASSFLKQTDWLGEHPQFRGTAFETLQSEMGNYISHEKDDEQRLADLLEHPFSAAFFGGRIESAAVGEFLEECYDYDVNSAYPFALANFPKWAPDDLLRVEWLDSHNRIGMYYVEWNCPAGAGFYPFPYRADSGNVFYPPRGKGWYMSPEIYSALEVWGPQYIKVKQGYVLDGTEGCGDGLHKLPADKLCTTAVKMDLMATIRLKAKDEKGVMEKALKLCMNSCYGKTVQQVGSHKYLNLFAASWITGTCRAIISRTIGKDLDHSTISVMTDGILTRKPLPVKLGKNLGEFELTEFDQVIQFMPGVYFLKNSKTGKVESKYRGMDRGFNPELAKDILWTENHKYKDPLKESAGPPPEGVRTVAGDIKVNYYPVNINMFVTRKLALHMKKKFDEHRYEFLPVQKLEEFSLRSKRIPGKKGFRLLKKEQHRFFPPKYANELELMVGGSKPYVLDFPTEDEYDEAEDEEELFAESRMSSILETDRYDLRG